MQPVQPMLLGSTKSMFVMQDKFNINNNGGVCAFNNMPLFSLEKGLMENVSRTGHYKWTNRCSVV